MGKIPEGQCNFVVNLEDFKLWIFRVSRMREVDKLGENLFLLTNSWSRKEFENRRENLPFFKKAGISFQFGMRLTTTQQVVINIAKALKTSDVIDIASFFKR